MTCNRFSFVIWFKFAIALRMLKKNANDERNAISLRFERKKRKSYSTTLKRKRKNRVFDDVEKKNRIRRRCHRSFENITNNSKFESLLRLRTISISTTTITITYWINFIKHENEFFMNCFADYIFFSKL